MPITIRELQQQRGELGTQAQAILDGAQAAGRRMTGEEEQSFDRILADRDALDAEIGRMERLREQDRAAADRAPGEPGATGPEGQRSTEQQQTAAWRSYLLGGRAAVTPEQARYLNMGSDPEGGFLVGPQQWVAALLQNVDDAVPLRGLATVQQITQAESLGVPTLDTDLNDAEWTSEVGTGSQDDSLRFGRRELRPNPLAKRVLVTRTLLRRATLSPEDIVRQRMAVKFGTAAERAYMTGDGNKKPLGLFTASPDGIPTSRDVQTGSATGFTGDGLIDAKFALKGQYLPKASWLFHRTAVREVRKLKDGQGNYLWAAGLGGSPDTILELPFTMSEFAPNTFTTGNYVGMLGDFSYYWIVDALALEVQRLVELYAEANKIGFIGRLETDGMPVLAEAFVRLKTN